MTVTELSSTAAEDELLDVVRLWRLAPGTHVAEVIEAATQCLVAGSDSESLRELAGASVRDSRFVLDPLVLRTVDELGLSGELESEVQLSAMFAMARRLRSGRVLPRQLASWAHTHIGHEGDAECQPFVTFDDMYDEAEYVGFAESELDEMVSTEVDALLAGNESPGLSLTWPHLPIVEHRGSDDRRVGWLRRLVVRAGHRRS